MSNKAPLVSVIIPNYNHGVYLKKRLDSVLDQSYQNFEVIILDDCSTDNSRDVIENYRGHTKISCIIYNEVNGGVPFYQWKKALGFTSGELIWIAESDDYADLNFLTSLVDRISDDVGIVFSDSNVVDHNGIIHNDYYKNFRNKNFNTSKWNSDYVITGIEEIEANLVFECTINNMSATIFKKDLVNSLDFDQLFKFKYCGDWYFLMSMALQTKIAYCAKPLNYFKYGTNNFKKGTKSTLNYLRERSMVRYFLWDELNELTVATKNKVYKQLGMEMRIMINETLKLKINPLHLFQMFTYLLRLKVGLFRKQMANIF
ncbi:glycosyltransferase family 2 protein [Pedobacter frigiditerrae]|uniref:glycosyltransferase family 2 protein n=1 Tax=Pedobacter frigiditerrae TaxID=2530452 RepID=UPI00292E5978|nr:glycosyltransferase family 2 protein [Pedobacter frigiditerrae]